TPPTSDPNRPPVAPSVLSIRPRIGVRTTSAAFASPPRTQCSTFPAASRTPSATQRAPDFMSSHRSPIQAPNPAPCGGFPGDTRPSSGLRLRPASIFSVSSAVYTRPGAEKLTSSGPSSPTSTQPGRVQPPSARATTPAEPPPRDRADDRPVLMLEISGSRVPTPIASATELNTRAMPPFQTLSITQLIGAANSALMPAHAAPML